MNEVQDPKQRDHSIGNSSGAEDCRSIQASSINAFPPNSMGGYTSNGGLQTDNESARMSNIQPYKYNIPNKLKDNPNVCKISKIHPNSFALAPLSRKDSKTDTEAANQRCNTTVSPNGYKSPLQFGDNTGAESMLSGASTGVNTQLMANYRRPKEPLSAAATPLEGNQVRRANN